jgi:hypothetical protein
MSSIHTICKADRERVTDEYELKALAVDASRSNEVATIIVVYICV